MDSLGMTIVSSHCDHKKDFERSCFSRRDRYEIPDLSMDRAAKELR